MKTISMTCPKCGAPMKTDTNKDVIVCEYCGNTTFSPNMLKKMTVSSEKTTKFGELMKTLRTMNPKSMEDLTTAILIIGMFGLVIICALLLVLLGI